MRDFGGLRSTEWRRMSEELERVVSLLRATLEATADGLLIVDREGRIRAWNKRFAEIWRVPEDVLCAASDRRALDFALSAAEDPEAFAARVRWLYEHPDEESFELIGLKDGRRLERVSKPQRLGDEVVGRVWSFRDVTGRERTQEALRESEERYRALWSKTPVMGHSIGPDGRILSVTDRWLEELGYRREEVIGHRSVEFLTPESAAFAEREVLPAFFEKGFCHEVPYQFVRRDGTVMDVLLSATVERDAQGRVLRSMAVLEDVTERHRLQAHRDRLLAQEQQLRRAAQEALEKSDDALTLLRSVLRNAPVGLGILDRELRYVHVNDALASMHGVAPEQDLGRTVWEAVPELAELMVPILRRVLETGEPVLGVELELPPRDGHAAEHRLGSYYRVTDSHGATVGVGVVVVDLTERKRTEEKLSRLYAQAEDAVRLRDEFLSIASHELRTPITSLRLLVEGLHSGRLEATQENVQRAFTVARRQIGRLSALVDELLDVSRLQTGGITLHREQADLAEVLRHVLDALADTIERAGCPLVLRIDSPVPGLWDRSRLERVVGNLVTNAAKFGAGKPIEIVLERVGDLARLVVSDQGIGIAPERVPFVFGKFERAVSSDEYGGLGLGLFIVKQVVEAHGGTVRVESTPGRGARFTVELPIRQPAASAGVSP